MSEISGKKSVVAVVPCDTYDEEKVYGALRKGVELLGGIGAFVKPEERILVKPNFLLAADADKAATTHPAVMRGMFRLLQEEGYAHVLYGDSPGHGSCKGAAERLGLAPENCYGAQMADMSHEVLTPFPDGMTAKEFHFVREVGETDAIINLCKMKTHSLERVSQEPLRADLRLPQGCRPCEISQCHGLCPGAGGYPPLREAPAACDGRHYGHGGKRSGIRHSHPHEGAALLRGPGGVGYGVLSSGAPGSEDGAHQHPGSFHGNRHLLGGGDFRSRAR